MTPAFEFAPATPADFDALLALRIAVMRESLERIGRFDPERARARFRETFRPADTRWIVVKGAHAGCVGFWPEPVDAMRIEHFYLELPFQRLGLGAAVIGRLLKTAPEGVRLVRVGALRASDANRFYQRQGFVKTAESEWDIAYERDHDPAAG
jgi:GNAT superfamily N-acetyltransferase